MYKAGIVAAITDLKDRTGSSRQAIKKHIEEANKGKAFANGMFLKVLKDMVAAGDLVQVKGSYKLSADFKKAAAVSAIESQIPDGRRLNCLFERACRPWLSYFM